MKEITDIIFAYDRAVANGLEAALATVVKVEGSSYRQPGARMLVTEDGMLTGAISGGCLEGDALRKALLCINQKKNKIVMYDTSSDEDSDFGVQLGCNGIVHILFEYLDRTKQDNAVEILKQLKHERRDAVTVTLFSLAHNQDQYGTIILYSNAAEPIGSGDFESLIPQTAAAFESKSSCIQEIEWNTLNYQALFQFHQMPLSLIIAGAGNDVMPLEKIASILGWEITIVDGRAAHAKPERFPNALKVLNLKAPQVLENISIDSRTFFLLMTHNYQYDLALLKMLIPTETPYIGILGPKSKWERMTDDLENTGIVISDSDRERIYTPIGLDIGAETSEEIAVSIVAEIQAFLNKKSGSSLKLKPGKIHNETQQIL